MKLTFIGAAHEVTGSCTLLDCCGGNFLIDYGMEQGVNVFENVPLPVLPGQIDAVFLTHAHIDHSGMLPKLYKDGFRGKVYATRATENLCRIMLMDSANIQVSDAEWMNRRAARAGRNHPLRQNQLPGGRTAAAAPVQLRGAYQSSGRRRGSVYRCWSPAWCGLCGAVVDGRRRNKEACLQRRCRQYGPAADRCVPCQARGLPQLPPHR
mgnify:CR=1 FL=1